MGLNPNAQSRPGELRIQGINIQGLNQGGIGMPGQQQSQQPQRLNVINITGNPQQQSQQNPSVRNPNQMDIINMATNLQGQGTNQQSQIGAQPQQQSQNQTQSLNPALVLNALSNVQITFSFLILLYLKA